MTGTPGRNQGRSGNALDGFDIAGVMFGLQSVVPSRRCFGRTVTAGEMTGPKGSFTIDDFKLGHVIDAAVPGDVIVIDNAGHPVSTWGGMATCAAVDKGIAGLVVDVGVRDRDREEMEQFGLPVFSRHIVPTTGKTRIKIEAIGEPVSCGGVIVRPGDFFVANGTGIVVVPADSAERVMETAMRYSADDHRAMTEFGNGLSFRDTLGKFAKISENYILL